MMDFELEEELRNTDELLENLQAREGRLGKSNVQPLPSPPTFQWRKRDSQGEIIYKYPRAARRATVERLRSDHNNLSGPLVEEDDLRGGPANASETADTILEELKRLLDTEEGDDMVMPMQDHQPRSASNDWTIRTEMREERWKEARSSLVENILKGEDASSSSCQQCRSNAAIVRCRDCLPYPFLCASCDEKRHGFCQEAGQISAKHLVRLLPVEIPAHICDCSNGTVLVSSGRPMTLITMNGKEDFCITFFLMFITISLLSYNSM
ncbi:hypothetical protein R3I93_016962 [Phoxinus phoxinus]|uniref:Uncharacterized protein n=1 Tax=Phoxinus phoxinus TaxID=58324 RepID=A0AAN9CHF7_9TELE